MAYIVRDYSKNHDRSDLSTTKADQMWFGREEYIQPKLETDHDPRSETHLQRIPALEVFEDPKDQQLKYFPIMEKRTYYNYLKPTKQNIEMLKMMAGTTMDDQETEYVFVTAKGGRVVSAEDPADVFEITVDDAKLEDRNIMKIRRKKELAEITDSRSTAKIK